MRDGRDLNQHGQAGRQEQASSRSPVTFHDVLFAAAAARPRVPNAAMPHTMATGVINLLNMIPFISFFLFYKTLRCLSRNVIQRRRWSIMKASGAFVSQTLFSALREQEHTACCFRPKTAQLFELPWPGVSASSFVITFSML